MDRGEGGREGGGREGEGGNRRWKELHKEKLHGHCSQDTVRMTRSRTTRWARNVARMKEWCI